MKKSASVWRDLRTSLGFLNWIFNPLQRHDVRSVYDLLIDQSPTSHARYLNLGYWDQARNLDDACDALVRKVGASAALSADDVLLDVGFGFGDQDVLWWREFTPKRILGLNITASQVARARARIAGEGLAQHIDLRLGSATAMPVAAKSVDVVIALECAFHFQTRERFFAEAYRVLRPGGRLVIADIIPLPIIGSGRAALLQRWTWGFVARKFAIPRANAYPLATYRSKLASSGFERVEVVSIRDQVYPPLHGYLRDHPQILSRLHPLLGLTARLSLKVDANALFAGLDYVLATAVKPPASGEDDSAGVQAASR